MGVSIIDLLMLFTLQNLFTDNQLRVNGNSIPASFSMLTEVIRDASLLSRVRTIVEKHRLDSPPGTLDFDFEKLCSDPLLQSIYAETLRLRVASFIFRGPERTDFRLKQWLIPKDAVILISGYAAQMDKEAWEGSDRHPVEEFYAGRFLQYPKNDATDQNGGGVSEETLGSQSPNFSLEGRASNWIPYGGGQRMCPGRHFNKLEMISSLAIMLTLFDIELIDRNGNIPESDMNGYGFGALWPKGKTPVRIRNRVL